MDKLSQEYGDRAKIAKIDIDSNKFVGTRFGLKSIPAVIFFQEGELKELNLILKADVQGSLEAVRESVQKLSGDKVKVKVVHGAVGGVNESDVQLSIASKSLIVGFGVRGEPRAISEAEKNGVEVRFYRVI